LLQVILKQKITVLSLSKVKWSGGIIKPKWKLEDIFPISLKIVHSTGQTENYNGILPFQETNLKSVQTQLKLGVEEMDKDNATGTIQSWCSLIELTSNTLGRTDWHMTRDASRSASLTYPTLGEELEADIDARLSRRHGRCLSLLLRQRRGRRGRRGIGAEHAAAAG
jgi:hypothetical protein